MQHLIIFRALQGIGMCAESINLAKWHPQNPPTVELFQLCNTNFSPLSCGHLTFNLNRSLTQTVQFFSFCGVCSKKSPQEAKERPSAYNKDGSIYICHGHNLNWFWDTILASSRKSAAQPSVHGIEIYTLFGHTEPDVG